MDLNITGTGYTPKPKTKASYTKSRNGTQIPSKRADIQFAQHRQQDQGMNISAKFEDLEVVGKNPKGTKSYKSPKKSNKLEFTPIEQKKSPNSSLRQSQFNNEDFENAATLNAAGFTEEDIANIYGGSYKTGEEYQREKSLEKNDSQNLSAQKRLQILKESQEQYADISERIQLSGGFKIPDVSLEKRQERIRNMFKQKEEPVQQEEEELTKRRIMEQLGVRKNDVDEYFDVLDERVYEREQDQEVHQILENQVESKISSVHDQQQALLRRKAELEREKAEFLAKKQEKLDRLYGYKRPQQQNLFEQQIDEQEQQYEESGQVYDQDIQDLKQGSKQGGYLDKLDNNLRGIGTYNQQQQLEEEATTLDENLDNRKIPSEEESLDEEQQNQRIFEQYNDKYVDELIHYNKPTFDQTQNELENHREKMKALEALYKNRKEISDKYEKEQKKIKEKIQKGIMRAPITQEEKEQRLFEEEFKNFVKERKKKDERVKMAQTSEKKEFELFQSTSPNPVSQTRQTHAHMRENISTLYPEDIQKQLRKQAREGQKFDNINEIDVVKSGYMSTLQGFNKRQPDSIDSEMTLLQALFEKLDRGDKGKIDKLDLAQELLKNKEVSDLYNLQDNQINKELKNFKSQNPNFLTLQEMVRFLKQDRKIKKVVKTGNYFAEEIRKSKKTEEQEEEKVAMGNCLLLKEHIQIMKAIFDQVDKDQDWVIRRADLIQALREDVRIARILHLPAVYLASIDKQLTTERVLYRVEKEEYIGDEQSRKNKEFITWTQFLEYFTDSVNINKKSQKQQVDDNIKSKHMKLYSQIKHEVDDQNQIELTDVGKQILKDAFDQTEKQSDIYVNTTYFVQNVKLQNQYQNISGSMARTKAKNYDLKEELFYQVIDRIEEEAEEFIEYDEIMDFFTKRGRPIGHPKLGNMKSMKDASQPPQLIHNEDDYLGQNPHGVQGEFNQSMKKSILKNKNYMKELQKSQHSGGNNEDESIDDREYIDAYDSDPETYYNQSRYMPNKPEGKISKLKRSVTNNNFNKDKSFNQYGSQELDGTQQPMARQSVGFKGVYSIDDFEDNQSKFVNESQLDNQRVNYKQYGQSGKKTQKDEFRVTKPEPYQFDEREKQRKMTRSISQRRFDEMIEEKEREQREIYSQTFKANPVPGHVKQPLYKKLMHDQEQRRQDVKANSIAITLSREKPFSFYQRDIENMKAKKKNKYEREQFVFKANKVPWYCSVKLLDRIENEEKLKRQERVAKEAQRVMQMSKLPPRMEMHEQQKKVKEMMEGVGTLQEDDFYETNNRKKPAENLNCTFQPPKAKPIPDFDRLQKTFQDNLDKRRQSKRPTVPKPFDFQETRKAPTRDYLDQDNTLMKREKEKPKVDKIEEARKVTRKQPQYMPLSTKKFEQYVEKQKKEKEEKQKQIEIEEKKQKKKEEQRKKMAQQFRNNPVLQQDNQDRKEAQEKDLERKKEEQKKNADEWKDKKKKILKDAKQQPYLIERPPVRVKELNKLRSLNRMYNVMIKGGASERDIKDMFTKDEMEKIEDLKFLRKHYPKYFQEIEDEEAAIAVSQRLQNE